VAAAASGARPSPGGNTSFTTTTPSGAASALASPVGSPASAASVLCSTGRACDSKAGMALADVRKLRAARRLELVPIDHGLCLPAITALDEVSCSWVHWKQAREPLAAASRRYVLSLDGRADALMLWAIFGDRIKPSCLLTLRVCTVLLQEGVRAGLTLSEVGLMMVRGSGVGLVDAAANAAEAALGAVAGGGSRHGGSRHKRRHNGKHGAAAAAAAAAGKPSGAAGGAFAARNRSGSAGSVEGMGADGPAPAQLSALEQAVRKARRAATRARKAAGAAAGSALLAAGSADSGGSGGVHAPPAKPGGFVSPLLRPAAGTGGAAAAQTGASGDAGLPPRPQSTVAQRGAATASATASVAAGSAAAAATAAEEQKKPWNVATKRRDRAKKAAAAAAAAAQRRTAAGAAGGGANSVETSPRRGGTAAPGLLARGRTTSDVGSQVSGPATAGGGYGSDAAATASPPLAGAAGSVAAADADVSTLSFLPYHDAVVEAFTVAVQPHIAAALRRRSQLAAGSGLGIWGGGDGGGRGH
jgi:hypothetical protein